MTTITVYSPLTRKDCTLSIEKVPAAIAHAEKEIAYCDTYIPTARNASERAALETKRAAFVDLVANIKAAMEG